MFLIAFLSLVLTLLSTAEASAYVTPCELDVWRCSTGLCPIEECSTCDKTAICTTTNPHAVVPRKLPQKTTELELIYKGSKVELTPVMFDHLPNLERATISGNISAIAANTFRKQRHFSSLTVSNSKLKALPDKLFWRNTTLEYLGLANNQLKEIPTNLFSDIANVKRLDFSNNPLNSCRSENDTIAPEFGMLKKLDTLKMSGYGSSIELCQKISKDYLLPIKHVRVLDLSESLLFYGDQRILSSLIGLKILHMKDVAPYKYCPSSAKQLFSNMPRNLSRIVLQGWASNKPVNKSCVVDNSVLNGLKKLKNLTFFDAQYGDKIFGNSVSKSLFDGFSHINTINIHWCGIAAIERGAFNSVSEMTYLGLAGNSLGPRMLELYTSNQGSILTTLDLNSVGINAVKYHASNLLTAFPALRVLYMNNNYLPDVPDFGLTRNISSDLYALTLSVNNIKILSPEEGRQICGVMQSLKHLSAESNKLSDITGLMLCPVLENLYLANNLVGDNAESNFQALTQMRQIVHLDLTANRLRYLPAGLFDNLTHLVSLYVADNQIVILSTNFFQNANSLETLDFSNNLLTAFNSSIVSNGLTKIKSLYLQANQISVLSPEMLKIFSNNFPKLRRIGLEGNPLICTCDDYLSKWAKNSPAIMQVKYLTCSTPSHKEVTTQIISYQPNPFLCKVKLPLVISAEVLAAAIVAILIALPCYKYRWYLSHPRVVFRAIGEKLREVKFDQKCEYDAFISYDASNDCDSRWVADKLIPAVETQKSGEVPLKPDLKLYVVDRDSAIGSPKYTERCRAIESSRKIIFILSNSYLTNPTCISEADLVAGYQLMDGQHCYHPNRILVLTLEELNDKTIRAPVTALLTENVINVTENDTKMKTIWHRVRRFISKPEYIYRKKKRKRNVRNRRSFVYAEPAETDPLVQQTME